MKRFLSIVILLFFVGGMVIPWDPNEEWPDKAYWDGTQPGNQFFFPGFDFGKYNPDVEPKGLTKKLASEIQKLYDTYPDNLPDPSWNGGNFYFLGHSQGGLRSLATAAHLSHLKDTGESDLYDRLDGVITVSGIDRGLRALEGGIPALRAKLQQDYVILKDGVKAVYGAFPTLVYSVAITSFVGDLIPFVPREIAQGVSNFLMTAPDDISGVLPYFTAFGIDVMEDLAYVAYALQGRENELQEINDMVPYSDYIMENVVTGDPPRLEKVPDGYRSERRIFWLLFIPIPYMVRVPNYKLVEIPSENEELRIGEELPIGYIVGLKGDPLSMVENQGMVNGIIFGVELVLALSINIHVLKTLAIFGLFTGSPIHIGNALRALKYMDNINGQINRVLGSESNDGLVARESQYYPKSMHGNVLLGEDLGYVPFDNHHHESIIGKNDADNSDVQRTINEMVDLVARQRRRP